MLRQAEGERERGGLLQTVKIQLERFLLVFLRGAMNTGLEELIEMRLRAKAQLNCDVGEGGALLGN